MCRKTIMNQWRIGSVCDCSAWGPGLDSRVRPNVFYVYYICIYKKKCICIYIRCLVSITLTMLSLGLNVLCNIYINTRKNKENEEGNILLGRVSLKDGRPINFICRNLPKLEEVRYRPIGMMYLWLDFICWNPSPNNHSFVF